MNTNIETRALALREPWSDSVLILVKHVDRELNKVYHGELHMKEVSETVGTVKPTVSLSQTAAQTLMDGLWNCGLRPTEGSGSAGSLAATQKHLEDMRELVFQCLAPIATVDFKKP